MHPDRGPKARRFRGMTRTSADECLRSICLRRTMPLAAVSRSSMSMLNGYIIRFKGNPTRILDLGCGPGLYTSRLARLGHCCVGIDFSEYAGLYERGIPAALG